MQENKITGIVLNSYDYKEKDKIIKIFTYQSGIITALVRAVKAKNAKLKTLTMPLTFADIIILRNKDFNIVKTADIIDSFYPLSKNLNNFYSAFLMLEMVEGSLMKNEANELIFFNLIKGLNEISYKNTPAKKILLKFILGILKVAGYKFNFKQCSSCMSALSKLSYLDINTGEIVCTGCKTSYSEKLTFESLEIIRSFYNKPIDKVSEIVISDEAIDNILKIIILNYENRFNSVLKIKKELGY